jgi:hypothetical protein
MSHPTRQGHRPAGVRRPRSDGYLRSAMLAGAASAALVLIPSLSLRTAEPPSEVPAELGAEASFSLRPSHNRLYQAEVVATSAPVAWRRGSDWFVRVTYLDGRPVPEADVHATLWRVDDDGPLSPIRMTGPLTPIRVVRMDEELFRLRGVRLDGPGWWHLKLSVASPAGLDSLAFNVFDPGQMPGTGIARDYPRLRAFAWSYVLPALTVAVAPPSGTARRGGAMWPRVRR